MPKVLNQSELDALLDLVQSEGADAADALQNEPPDSPLDLADNSAGYNVLTAESVDVFDFKRPERVTSEQAAALEVLHESFSHNVSASLSGYLRTLIEVRLISVEQFTYSEFTMSVPSPTVFASLSCRPLAGNMVLEMNPSIIFPFIDRLLGGANVKPALIERPFTQIEQGLIHSILARILDQLDDTWRAIQPIEFRVVECETNPMLMQIVAPSEPVILLSFEVAMGNHSGLINLGIPFKVIQPIIEELTRSNWFSTADDGDSDEDRKHLLENLRKAPVNLKVTLAEVSIGLNDLLTLREGDIIDLGKPRDAELLLDIEKETAFLGHPAVHRGKYALVISSQVDPRETIL